MRIRIVSDGAAGGTRVENAETGDVATLDGTTQRFVLQVDPAAAVEQARS